MKGALGLTVVILAAGALAVVYIKTSARGFSAREAPTALEAQIARTARSIALPDSVKSLRNPAADTAEVLSQARAHWADHCATCHANNGSGDTEMGRNLYPRAPDMRQSGTQSLTDGELFTIIENGIRLSGMPAWGGSDHSSEDSWKLVRFIRHLPRVTAAEEREMLKLNPRTPAELQEEKEEEEFLKGSDPHANHTHHH